MIREVNLTEIREINLCLLHSIRSVESLLVICKDSLLFSCLILRKLDKIFLFLSIFISAKCKGIIFNQRLKKKKMNDTYM